MGRIVSPVTGTAINPEIENVPWAKLKMFVDMEEFMKQMGLSIHCVKCSRIFGPPNDGIRMTIDKSHKEFTIECNHCKRICRTPAPITI